LGGGLALDNMAAMYGFEIHSPDMWIMAAGISDHIMADIYSTFDVYMMLTRGEGFGIPIIEAQATGTPVIVTDFTAPRDLVGSGWKIPSIGKRLTPLVSWWAEPSVDAAVDALEEAYALWEQDKLEDTYRDKAVEFAKQFDFAAIRDKYLLPFFERVENEIKEEKASNERGGQAPVEPAPKAGVDDTQQKPQKTKRRRRRKKR
jgi:glycosyltransferase involved in cell wall biosynthesis